MSKRSPGSKAQMEIGKKRYKEERQRHRDKLKNIQDKTGGGADG